jgi:hypothetical protein
MSKQYSSLFTGAAPARLTQQNVVQQPYNPQPASINPQAGAAPGGKSTYSGLPTTNTGGQVESWNDTRAANAAAAEATRKAGLQSEFDSQKNSLMGTFNDRLGAENRGMRSSVLDYLDTQRQGQKNIDNAGRDNAYARQSGMDGIMGMVGRGIKQGGMMLQSRNASDSSAAGEIAKAYAELGQREASTIGQQYEQGQSQIAQDQELLGIKANKFNRDYEDEKTNVTNDIVTKVMDQLSSIDARIADADLPGRIALDQEKTRITSQAIASLSQYDSQLRTDRAKIQPATRDEQNRQAAEMATEGADLGANAFDYQTEAPARFQGTGPFSSGLPIFTRPRGDRER